MKFGSRCTVCGERIGEVEVVRCDECGAGIHESCIEFERKYECEQCGDEVWIGAVEF